MRTPSAVVRDRSTGRKTSLDLPIANENVIAAYVTARFRAEDLSHNRGHRQH